MSDDHTFSASWSPGADGDAVLEALRKAIDKKFGASSSIKPMQSAAWSVEALLLAQIEYRLAALTWTLTGCKGKAPVSLTDVAGRLQRLGLLPDGGDDGTAGVPA